MRSDLVCDLVRYGLHRDEHKFRKTAEAICAEERAKRHIVVSDTLESLLNDSQPKGFRTLGSASFLRSDDAARFLVERVPQRTLDALVLPDSVLNECGEFVEENKRADLLRSYDLEPRNKILLIGPPGNGKTSLVEALANELMVPLLTVRYETVVGSYLGETSNRLSKVFEIVRNAPCVLFFDEFETLGKERGDQHETGEIKRVVSSLLLQIDQIPSNVIFCAATNHEGLLDKAAWRRFQLRLRLPKPDAQALEKYFRLFEEARGFKFGCNLSALASELEGTSFAEVEEFCFAVLRRHILNMPRSDVKELTKKTLEQIKNRVNSSDLYNEI